MPGKWGGARRARPPLDPPMLWKCESDPSCTVSGQNTLIFKIVVNNMCFVLENAFGKENQIATATYVIFSSDKQRSLSQMLLMIISY